MSRLIKDWLEGIFIHHASSQTKSNRSSLFGETLNDRCTLVDQPSTMSDADAMHCDDEENSNTKQTSKTSVDPKVSRKETVVVDRFQACFIDCECQCEVNGSDRAKHSRLFVSGEENHSVAEHWRLFERPKSTRWRTVRSITWIVVRNRLFLWLWTKRTEKTSIQLCDRWQI